MLVLYRAPNARNNQFSQTRFLANVVHEFIINGKGMNGVFFCSRWPPVNNCFYSTLITLSKPIVAYKL